jgi:hypothetical protein
VNWLGPVNAWAAVYGMLVLWLGILLGWVAQPIRNTYLRTRLR